LRHVLTIPSTHLKLETIMETAIKKPLLRDAVLNAVKSGADTPYAIHRTAGVARLNVSLESVQATCSQLATAQRLARTGYGSYTLGKNANKTYIPGQHPVSAPLANSPELATAVAAASNRVTRVHVAARLMPNASGAQIAATLREMGYDCTASQAGAALAKRRPAACC
jgi:hypothetical protein